MIRQASFVALAVVASVIRLVGSGEVSAQNPIIGQGPGINLLPGPRSEPGNVQVPYPSLSSVPHPSPVPYPVVPPEVEAVRRRVDSMYRQTLGRAPDAEGLHNWSDGLLRGTLTLPDVYAAMLGGGEMFDSVGHNRVAWIDLLYHRMLGRCPSAYELQWWTRELDQRYQGDRPRMVREWMVNHGK